MSDYVTIANLAAGRIGTETRISSPDDNRFVARTIKAAWDIQRQAAIRDGAWNFATRRKDLAAEADGETIYPWEYAFPLPEGCLRLIEVLDTSRDDYQLEGKVILANTLGPLYIRYLVDVPEPALWDAGFAESFALRLAWRCGRRIAGSAFDQDQCGIEYKDSLKAAKRVDARENPPIDQEESSWVQSRYIPHVSTGWR
ncbi:hypothetical protein [Sphingorhabdus sp.]|jgi:hypothetical protein|uniref:hypothetical protein n=1 Tax=Sphingorhabdus sp. TaxID=1902408 RepID=UPI0037CB3B38